MDCHDAQARLLEAEGLSPEEIAPPELARHLASCEGCREFAAELLRLEAAWRAIPLPDGVDRAREVFLQRLTSGDLPARPVEAAPPRRRVAVPRRWLVAASVLLMLGIGGGVLVSLPQAAASSDVVERLVDWNLDLARSGSADERSRIYVDQAARLEEAVKDASLPVDERELADSLLKNAPWLAANRDPLAEADRFNEVADSLVRRMTSATRGGDVRRAKRYAKLYQRIAASGIAAKLDTIEHSGALDFERQRRLERLVLRDTDRMRELLALLERAPDSTRREIKRALGIVRKPPKRPATSAAPPQDEPVRRGRKARPRGDRPPLSDGLRGLEP